MDVVKLLRIATEQLPAGDYTTGLNAIQRHIQAAVRHFERDKSEDPDGFTDAIYRTNQAYEGALKEAYRVLASEDPTGVSTFQIEQYLEREEVLRPKVLAQLTRYRQEYRNPSTHDYKLDFDENEALLAILSVAAFSKSMVDQIANRIAFVEAAKEMDYQNVTTETISGSSPEQLFHSLTTNLLQFMNKSSTDGVTERENTALVAAYLSRRNVPIKLEEVHEYRGWTIVWDITVDLGSNYRVGFDVKSSRGRQSLDITNERISNVHEYLHESGFKYGVLIEGAARGEQYVLSDHLSAAGTHVARLGRDHAC